MEFRWIDWNLAKVASHGVTPEEAEQVVETAVNPYPQYRGDGKLLVWGLASGGRLLQVVYLFDNDDTVFVIHARPLTRSEKHRLKRQRRPKGSP